MQNTIQQQSLKNDYDAMSVFIKPVQYTQTTRSAFANERPAFAQVTLLIFKPIRCVCHNSALVKEWLWICLYTYEERTCCIALRTCKVHLAALFTDTHTDKYDLRSSVFTLRTVTNSSPFGLAIIIVIMTDTLCIKLDCILWWRLASIYFRR